MQRVKFASRSSRPPLPIPMTPSIFAPLFCDDTASEVSEVSEGDAVDVPEAEGEIQLDTVGHGNWVHTPTGLCKGIKVKFQAPRSGNKRRKRHKTPSGCRIHGGASRDNPSRTQPLAISCWSHSGIQVDSRMMWDMRVTLLLPALSTVINAPPGLWAL